MSAQRAVVVLDKNGVLEVFGPYWDQFQADQAYDSLAAWADGAGDPSVVVSEVELHPWSRLNQWINDPERFYLLDGGE